MEKMLNELRAEKEEMVKKREELKKENKAMPDNHPSKAYTLSKIRKIEQDLKTEFYKIVEDQEMDKPSVGKPKAPQIKGK